MTAEFSELAWWAEHGTVFQLDGGKPPYMLIEAREQRDGSRKWVVTQGGNCLRKDGDWEWEASPSNRSEEFVQMTRWDSKEAAREFAEAWMWA